MIAVKERNIELIKDHSTLSAWSISRFKENLSNRPYLSNIKNHCHISSKDKAEEFKYIQANNPIKTSWIVIDVDVDVDKSSKYMYQHPEFYEHIETPIPNIALRNPKNGHFQLLYAIDSVYTGSNARRKPQQFLKSIKQALISSIPFADPNFIGSKVISWNPLSCHWEKYEMHRSIYSLNELKESINEKHFPAFSFNSSAANESTYATEGERNVSIFNSLRAKAYRRVSKAKEEMFFDDWLCQISNEAKKINSEICETPLSEREVRGIAKSVANFSWFKYTGNAREKVMSFQGCETTKEKQKASAKRTHKIIQEKTIKAILRAVEIVYLEKGKVTLSDIAKSSGKHRATVSKYKEDIALQINKLKEMKQKDSIKSESKNVNSAVHQVSDVLSSSVSKPYKLLRIKRISGISDLLERKVSFDQHISYKGSLYSVPCLPSKNVFVGIKDFKLSIIDENGKNLAFHSVSNRKYSYRTCPDHLIIENRLKESSRLLYWSKCIHPNVYNFCNHILNTYLFPEQGFRKVQAILAILSKLETKKLIQVINLLNSTYGLNWSSKKVKLIIKISI